MIKESVKFIKLFIMSILLVITMVMPVFADVPDGFTGTSTVNGVVYYYYKGELLDSKETYLSRRAAEYTSPDYYGSIQLTDGTTYWLYMGNYYGSEEEAADALYKYNGYIPESEAVSIINSWYDKNANTVDFNVKYHGTSVAFDTFFSKLNNIDALTYYTYREHIMTSRSYSTTTGGNKYEITMQIDANQHGTKEQIEQGKAAARDVAVALKGKSTYEQIKGAFEWLCNNIEYDHHSADNNLITGHSLYSAMIGRKTVCEGYASSFQIMMDTLGIECYIVKGNVDGDHAWNVVKIDGNWYQVDATWADQSTFIDYDYLLMGTNKRGNVTTLPLSATAYSNGQSNVEQNATQETKPPVTTSTTAPPIQDTKPVDEQNTTENVTSQNQTEETTENTTSTETASDDKNKKDDETTANSDGNAENETENKKDKEVTENVNKETKSSADNESKKDNNSNVALIIVIVVAAVIVTGGVIAFVIVRRRNGN